jgi:uncharacterized damage-inducible protein DinB
MGLDNLTLTELISLKANALSAITRTVSRLSTEKARIRPSPEKWSVGENLEHLVLVETQVVQLIESLLSKTERSAKPRDAEKTSPLSVEALQERSLAEQYKTRDRYNPTGTVAMGTSLRQLQELQSRLFALEPRLRFIDLKFASFPHWIFGPLTLGEWLAFVGLHEERHFGQIKSVLASTGFLSATPE